MEVLWIAPEIARGVLGFWPPPRRRRPAPERDAAAREDPARGARRRDGRPRRGPVRPLLRQRRFDAALRDAGRRPTCDAPATRLHSHAGPHVDRALAWIERVRRLRRRRVHRVRAPDAPRGWSSRGGRTRTTRSFTPTARWPRDRSRCARCRATSTRAFRGGGGDRHRAGPRRRGRRAYLRKAQMLRGAVRRDVLGRGAGDVRAGARRHEAPVSGAQLERRPRAAGPGSPSPRRRAARPRR